MSQAEKEIPHPIQQGQAACMPSAPVSKKWKHQVEKGNRKLTPLLPCQGLACCRFFWEGEKFLILNQDYNFD